MGLSDFVTEEERMAIEAREDYLDEELYRPFTKKERKEYRRLLENGCEHSAWIYKKRCLCGAEDFTMYIPEEGEIQLIRWKTLSGMHYLFAPVRDIEGISEVCAKAMTENYGVDAGTSFPAEYGHENFWTDLFDEDRLEFRESKGWFWNWLTRH